MELTPDPFKGVVGFVPTGVGVPTVTPDAEASPLRAPEKLRLPEPPIVTFELNSPIAARSTTAAELVPVTVLEVLLPEPVALPLMVPRLLALNGAERFFRTSCPTLMSELLMPKILAPLIAEEPLKVDGAMVCPVIVLARLASVALAFMLELCAFAPTVLGLFSRATDC